MSIEGEVLSLQQAEQNVIDTKELATLGSVFLFHKKVLSYVIKMLRGDRSATERKMALHDLPQEEKPAGEIPFYFGNVLKNTDTLISYTETESRIVKQAKRVTRGEE